MPLGGISSNVNLADILRNAPSNLIIQDSFTKAHSVLKKYDNALCSVSGGSDSDLLIDICSKLDPERKIDYIWFDTGIEYQATHNHLDYLEKKYGIRIERIRSAVPIPTACKRYGQPFLSKLVSEYIMRLQRHNFDFTKGFRSYDELLSEYPSCKSALDWWCNRKGGAFNISRNKLLKDFLIEHPPTFRISSRCCKYSKKDTASRRVKERGYQLQIIGIRRSEGGMRIRFHSCFDASHGIYRPLLWYMAGDKREYEEHYHICHSACYTEYGLKRTGCVGCPFARNLNQELQVLKIYEPKLYLAACHIFRDSYEYTNTYWKYRQSKELSSNKCVIYFNNPSFSEKEESLNLHHVFRVG